MIKTIGGLLFIMGTLAIVATLAVDSQNNVKKLEDTITELKHRADVDEEALRTRARCACFAQVVAPKPGATDRVQICGGDLPLAFNCDCEPGYSATGVSVTCGR